MGLEIERDEFAEEEYRRFADRLRACVEVLEEVLARPGFGDGPATLGAELEFSLIDDALHPAPCNRAVLQDVAHRSLPLERRQPVTAPRADCLLHLVQPREEIHAA